MKHKVELKSVKGQLLVTCLCMLTLAFDATAQLTINNTTNTVSQLVNGILVPSSGGTTVSNIAFSGVYNQSSRYQVGYFSTAGTTATQMGLSSGVVLTTGHTSELPLTLGVDPRASQYTRNYVSCTTGEVRKGGTCPNVQNDLNVLSGGGTYYNTAILEFDFVPVLGSVSFRYIFGSEEYSDNSGLINYQCSDYSDRFGFLLSGPGISGGQGYTNDAKNIARLSNGSIVSINSVNNGVVGSSGGGPSAAKCLAANAAWVNGSPTADYLGTIDGTQMNGNTRILTAYQNGLTPGQTYHIKLIIMDLSDGGYESVVYLEGGSFTTSSSGLPVELTDFTGECSSENGVELNWRTETERNNDYFLVERSDAAMDFQVIDTVQGNGSTNQVKLYSYADKAAPFGTNYYRLRQIDFDGRSEELPVISVDATCEIANPNGIEIGYDPRTNQLIVSYDVKHPEDMVLNITNMLGQRVVNVDFRLEPTKHVFQYQLPSDMSAGMYVTEVLNGVISVQSKMIK
jgi:hypothetical protein